MQAAILKAFGTPLTVETVADPRLGTGEVIVDVVAANVLPYMAEVFSGERRYPMSLPMVPGAGAIGRVAATGPDATRLNVGDWVWCDPTVRSRDDALAPDIALQGLSARGDGGLRLQAYFHDGSFAERMRVPTENAVALGAIGPEDAAAWCSLGAFLVPCGGLLAGRLRAGETLLISGATGNFGSAGVAVALAMGASCVVAAGRNDAMLDALSRRHGSRVRTVKLSGDATDDTARMKKTAPGPIDLVLDLLPPSASTGPVRAAVMTVREHGRAVLMGGVGMLGGDDLGLPYPWIMRNNITLRGQWMYPREAASRLVALIRSGQLRLDHYTVTTFALNDVNQAIAHAAAHPGGFERTVITP